MPHRADGFGFESRVGRAGPTWSPKEDGGRRLWEKAWGFNLSPMFYLATRRQAACH